MSVTLHNIAGAEPPYGYSHVAVARGTAMVYVSGQVGTDEQGAVVAGGLAAQTERALLNVAQALAAAGATFDNVAKVTFYVVNWDASMFGELMQGAAAARQQHPYPDVALTLIGVQSLFTPDMLIEIEAVAVIEA